MRTACAADTALCDPRLLADGAVCDNCRPRINELYQKQVRFSFVAVSLVLANSHTAGDRNLTNTGEIRETVDAVSTMSRVSPSGKMNQSSSKDRMMTASFQDVLCTSKDCPIFYMRKKSQKDVEDTVAMLERFDNELW